MFVKIFAFFLVTFILFLNSGLIPWFIFSVFSKNIRKTHLVNYIVYNIKICFLLSTIIALSSFFSQDILEIDLLNKQGNILFFIPFVYKVIMGLFIIVNMVILLILNTKRKFNALK